MQWIELNDLEIKKPSPRQKIESTLWAWLYSESPSIQSESLKIKY